MRISIIGLATLLALLSSQGAAAAEDSATAPAKVSDVDTTVPPAPARANPLGVKAVDAKVLARKRGGSDVVNDMQLKGVVSDNRAVNVTTGATSSPTVPFRALPGCRWWCRTRATTF